MKHIGTVKWYNTKKGYGFIAPDEGEDVFVHLTAVKAAGLKGLKDNQKIEYALTTEKGKVTATNIKLI